MTADVFPFDYVVPVRVAIGWIMDGVSFEDTLVQQAYGAVYEHLVALGLDFPDGITDFVSWNEDDFTVTLYLPRKEC